MSPFLLTSSSILVLDENCLYVDLVAYTACLGDINGSASDVDGMAALCKVNCIYTMHQSIRYNYSW